MSDPNLVCSTVLDRLLTLLQNDNQGMFDAVVGYDADPVDPALLLDRLPCLVIDYSYPPPNSYVEWSSGHMREAVLTVKYFHQVAASDPGGIQASRAVRRALWLAAQAVNGNVTLWNTVTTSKLLTDRKEEMPVPMSTMTGVMALWGWLAIQTEELVG